MKFGTLQSIMEMKSRLHNYDDNKPNTQELITKWQQKQQQFTPKNQTLYN